MAERRHQMLAHNHGRRWNDDPGTILWRWRGVTTGAIYTVHRAGRLKKQILSVTIGARTFGVLLNDDSESSRVAGKAAW